MSDFIHESDDDYFQAMDHMARVLDYEQQASSRPLQKPRIFGVRFIDPSSPTSGVLNDIDVVSVPPLQVAEEKMAIKGGALAQRD
jgi:hypothetical protein